MNNDALTKPARSREEAALDLSVGALNLSREIIADELECFIDGYSSYTKGQKQLDRRELTGYELSELERMEKALAMIDGALDRIKTLREAGE